MLNWFRKKPAPPPDTPLSNEPEQGSPRPQAQQQQPIVVHDQNGDRHEIPRSAFAAKVLPKQIEAAFDDPESLYQVIVVALQHQFYSETLPAARRLIEIDPNKERSAIILSIVLMKMGNLDDAERLLVQLLISTKSGPAMVNLAKIRDAQGKPDEAKRILREALSINPNLDNALEWFVAIARDAGGQPAYLAALREITGEPGSWRAQLWLARDSLQCGDIASALEVYMRVLSIFSPLPADALTMITGDLGRAGRIDDMIALVLPHYDERIHGIATGCNLVNACLDIGLKEQGLTLCDRLAGLERHDWTAWIHNQRLLLQKLPAGSHNP